MHPKKKAIAFKIGLATSKLIDLKMVMLWSLFNCCIGHLIINVAIVIVYSFCVYLFYTGRLLLQLMMMMTTWICLVMRRRRKRRLQRRGKPLKSQLRRKRVSISVDLNNFSFPFSCEGCIVCCILLTFVDSCRWKVFCTYGY